MQEESCCCGSSQAAVLSFSQSKRCRQCQDIIRGGVSMPCTHVKPLC